jgi:hypothetical protein
MVNEERQVYVEYNGRSLGWRCDSFTFQREGVNRMDDYEMCVTPIYFKDPNCNVKLEYRTTYEGRVLQVCTCLHFIFTMKYVPL